MKRQDRHCLALKVEGGLFLIFSYVVTGGVSMVIIFAIDKTIFAEGFGKKGK